MSDLSKTLVYIFGSKLTPEKNAIQDKVLLNSLDWTRVSQAWKHETGSDDPVNNSYVYNDPGYRYHNFIRTISRDGKSHIFEGSGNYIYCSTTFNYIKPELKIDIKIPLNQADFVNATALVGDKEWNYVIIQNSCQASRIDEDGQLITLNDTYERAFAYFITNKKIISPNTMKLTLEMDTLTTFADWILLPDDHHHLLDATTEITRQHKDRFTALTYDYLYHHPDLPYLNRRIDKMSEGITGVMHQVNSGPIAYNIDKWHLIYTSDTSSGVACYMTKENSWTTTLSGNSAGARITLNDMAEEHGIIFTYANNGAVTITANGKEFKVDSTHSVEVIRKRGTGWYVMRITNADVEVNYQKVYEVLSPTAEVTCPFMLKGIYGSNIIVEAGQYHSYGRNTEWYGIVSSLADIRSYGSTGTAQKTINGITDLDRTLSKLVKIIECPYCPVDIVNGLPKGFAVVENIELGKSGGRLTLLQLQDLNMQFKTTIATNSLGNFKCYIPKWEHRYLTKRNNIYESKLYHSELYQHKFIYDTASYSLPYENLEITTGYQADPVINIDYVQSNNISSNLLFKVYPVTTNTVSFKRQEDFEGVISSTRSNLSPIYNQAYIDYLNNGYIWDKQSIQKQNEKTWWQTGITAAGTVIGTAALAATGNIPTAAAVATGGIGLLGSIGNAINSVQQNEISLAQKLDQYAAQSASVTGSEDLSLFKYYSGNQMNFREYKISNYLATEVGKLFAYCGYACQEQGIPNFTSRRCYNFVQCNVQFDPDHQGYTKIIPFKEDIVEKFKLGVTVFHGITNPIPPQQAGTWIDEVNYIDWDREYENWEEWLCSRQKVIPDRS